MIGLCLGELPSGASFFRRYIMPAEARCQANRGINAVGFSKLTKYCDSFRFFKLFCVYFYWDDTFKRVPTLKDFRNTSVTIYL